MAFIIRAYNSKELAGFYNVSYYVFLRWVNDNSNEIGKQSARTWTPEQVKKMVIIFGEPPLKLK
jgi:hypothetical protein